jgi:hypothetical protein
VTGPAGTEIYEGQLKSAVSTGTAAAVRPSTRGRPLVVTSYVPEPVAESLRHQDIHYVDSAGNMFLRGKGLLIDIRGHRRPATVDLAASDRPLRAFKPSGLRVLFVLLAEPGLVNASYRDIARSSGTSLGTVQLVLKELGDGGYVDPGQSVRSLHRTRELFGRWVEAYAFDLHPRLTLARFDAADPSWWTGADDALRAAHAQWGGETAAHFLDRRLRPARAVVYAPEVPRRIALEYRMQKATGEGNVEIRERFWSLPDARTQATVPTPLVYADLIASGEPRLLEAATKLRERDDLLRRLDHS